MSKLEIQDKSIDILDVSNKCSFKNNVDVLNECFGANRSMYMRACYPQGRNDFLQEINTKDKIIVWMPKLYGNSSQWKNSISEDGTTIYEQAEAERTTDWMESDKHDLDAVRLVFVKKSLHDPYEFVGAFVSGKMDHLSHSYERIATKVRLIGNPVQEIELLDDSRNKDDRKENIRLMADRLGLEYRLLPYENQITLKNNRNRIVCMIRPSKDYYQLMSNMEFLDAVFHPGWRVKYAVRLSTIEEVEKTIRNEILPRFEPDRNEILAQGESGAAEFEAEIAEPDYVLEADLIDDEVNELGVEGTFREVVVKQRVNQSVFRERLLKKYSHCCLCNVSNKRLLIASHIKPWSVSSPTEKVDVNNGLLLCPNHDALFDQGYVSFDEDGQIIISDGLNDVDRVFMNINGDMIVSLEEGQKEYMKYHRNTVYEKYKTEQTLEI